MSKKFKITDFEAPSATVLKHKEITDGLSVTKNGRLLFTIQLQEEMGMKPDDRKASCYVKVLFHKDKEGEGKYIFYLQFFTTNSPPKDAKYKVYKPNRGNIQTSYFEISRFLKERGLITSVGDTDKFIEGGPVEILDKDVKEHSLVISLENRFKTLRIMK